MTLLAADGQTPISTPPRVLLAVPCQDMVHADWTSALCSMVGVTCLSRPDIQLVTRFVKGTLLPDQRNALVRGAREHNCSHILWLDADMTFPPDALLQLLAHDVDFVGANYATRRSPNIPTAEIAGEGLVYPSPGSSGLLPVSRMGFGLVLMKVPIFDKIPEPWFTLPFNPKTGEHAGEDVWFCRAARKAGIAPLIDLSISQQVGHLGQYNYDFSTLHAMRPVAQAEGAIAEEPSNGAVRDEG